MNPVPPVSAIRGMAGEAASPTRGEVSRVNRGASANALRSKPPDNFSYAVITDNARRARWSRGPGRSIRRDDACGPEGELIARCEPDRFRMALEPEDRRAPEQENPFGTILIVPEPRRARMRVGNDALDPQRRRPQQLRDLLLGAARRNIGEHIPGRDHFGAPPGGHAG